VFRLTRAPCHRSAPAPPGQHRQQAGCAYRATGLPVNGSRRAPAGRAPSGSATPPANHPVYHLESSGSRTYRQVRPSIACWARHLGPARPGSRISSHRRRPDSPERGRRRSASSGKLPPNGGVAEEINRDPHHRVLHHVLGSSSWSTGRAGWPAPRYDLDSSSVMRSAAAARAGRTASPRPSCSTRPGTCRCRPAAPQPQSAPGNVGADLARASTTGPGPGARRSTVVAEYDLSAGLPTLGTPAAGTACRPGFSATC